MLKPMNTRKNSFFHSFSISTSRFYEERKAHSSWGYFHNLQKLVHMQRRALAAESDYVRKIASSQSSSSLSFSADAREKGAVPLSLIGHIQLLISFTSVPRQRWVPNRGKQTAAPLSSKRGTGRERSFYIEQAHSAHRFPLKDITCVLLAQTHASNKPVSEDEKADDVFSRQHLYCGTPVVTSWAVAGQQVVFLHMYLQTRVTLRAFPVATPRGRSSSSHGGDPQTLGQKYPYCPVM